MATLLAACGGGAQAAATAAPLRLAASTAGPEASAATAASESAGPAGTGVSGASNVATLSVSRGAPGAPLPAAPAPQPNPDGASLTVSRSGFIDTANPFFTPMGNGRSCASCHSEDAGWSVTPRGLAQRFEQSQGTDAVFRLVDGANSPNAATATLDQKRLAYSMLLTKGLIRVGMSMPANAEFSLLRADDPYNFASARELSMLAQASDAVRGHAEAAVQLSAASQRAIVDFERGLFAAQSTSTAAGSLLENGASGGALALAATTFYPGINGLAGDSRTLAPFNRNVMTLFG
eukprot:gene34164-38615_t